ncbi:MAG TPA: hypothetical protein VL335_01990 [Candidatus Paceibacterota bacterium]|jgi:hypothetical protein|nr:hypothetical protein [Candidatus Paceibacterota bacterium]
MFQSLITQLQTGIFPQVIQYTIYLSPVLLAILLGHIFWPLWIRYIRAKFSYGLKYTLLELRLPKDVFKSPLAMEVVLQAIHNTANGSTYAQYWKGEYRPFYSLELISVEGQIKFFIWAEDRRKTGIMSALYSQYPGIEITEAVDYAQGIHFDPNNMKVWAADFKFTKDEPYPIKTYVDYGLLDDPKEELKVDPLVPVLEFLGNIGPNQQIWFQYIVQAHIKNDRKPGHLWKKTDLWKEESEKLINKILMRDPKTKIAGKKDKDSGFTDAPSLSKGEQQIAEAIERRLSKQAFDVGLRAIYFAQKDVFNAPANVGGIIAAFKHFTTEHMNGIKQDGDTWLAQFGGVPWEDYGNMRRNYYSGAVFKAYRRRSFFYPPYQGTPMIMNTEELATLFHLPGAVAGTPTLSRVPSKKGEAPTNLPI